MRNKGMEAAVCRRFARVRKLLNERQRRLWGAAEAEVLGYGGVSTVARATKISRRAIHVGLRELQASGAPQDAGRIRRPGAGRKSLTATQPRVKAALDALVEPTSRGDPQSPLRWTCRSVRRLADELQRQGFVIGRQKVADLLHELGYSLQANRKTQEGAGHPDRNAQFEYINRRVKALQRRGQPVISVDTKKKELVGNFRNGGCEWRPAGDPPEVRVHDFQDPERGKAIPYGVYDLTNNEAWVSVGVHHDTAAFAVQTIRRWWRKMGCKRFPDAEELLVTADGGGSNSARCKLWKVALQAFADETGLKVHVCHFPPGTSKWNKIEHRLFCHITRNWRGQPLNELEIIVQLIGRTTTREGLKVHAALDRRNYPKGVKVADDEFATIQLQPAKFHGDWNYTVAPRSRAA
ncbi:MAG: ISAzo13 family transposase [Phycisphaeraceae bacterium]|nr:ISAzo13 family transposase [Phycisphaeraceae bacterium]